MRSRGARAGLAPGGTRVAGPGRAAGVSQLPGVRRALATTRASAAAPAATATDGVPTTWEVQRATRARIAADGRVLGVRAAAAQVADVLADIGSSGARLRHLWTDPGVTDVLVNGPREVWVDRGAGLVRVPMDVGDVRALAVRLAAAAGARLDDAAPIVDGSLPDGTRLHAVLAPIAAQGACLSLRRHAPQALGLGDWCAGGGLGAVGQAVLTGLVAARANVIVSGGTGTGKTTLLASLLAEVGPHERIVCIEEARELAPDHPHVLHLQARAANVQGAGAVTLSELVRAALRMRPDRLVLGECRGAEVRDVLLALNTGHDGGLTTVHANTASDVPARLIALGSLANLTPEAVAVQAVSALDAVVHVVREGGLRRVAEVAVLGMADGRLEASVAMRAVREASGCWDLAPGPAWARLAQRLDALVGAGERRPIDLEASARGRLAAAGPTAGHGAGR